MKIKTKNGLQWVAICDRIMSDRNRVREMNDVKLMDLFRPERTDADDERDEPMNPADALVSAFARLTRGDAAVLSDISECLADTAGYFSSRKEMLDGRGLRYSAEAEPWLCVVAAVGSALKSGYLQELRTDCTADAFVSALTMALAAAKIEFSPHRLVFDPQKDIGAWAAQFNEYAGQSGITLYFVELYGESRVMGAARLVDYAEAAESAGFAGVKITSRPC